MFLLNSTRRRKVLFAALVIAAGGYASYRLYKSSARRRLHQVVSSLCFLSEAMTNSAESLSVLSTDLRSFLISDSNTVPRSLRQAFKIGQCPEFQDCLTVVSAAMMTGLLRGARASNGKESQGVLMMTRRDGKLPPQPNDLLRASSRGGARLWANPSEELTCREIREVSFSTERAKEDSPHKDEFFEEGFELNHQSAIKRSKKVAMLIAPSKRGQKDCKSHEDLPERLLSKLFSEPGVRFASAVTGALARSCVLAFYDSFQSSQDQTSINSMDASSRKIGWNSELVDSLCTGQCRDLITECIQTLVGTAVTVYIDKTKDVNFYQDMVAGITNPLHRDPMKELMTSVCNGAIETSVRTLHDVVFLNKTGQAGEWQHRDILGASCSSEKQPAVTHCLPVTTVDNKYKEVIVGYNGWETFANVPGDSIGEPCEGETQLVVMSAKDHTRGGHNGNSSSVKDFIEGVSETLAVPSNRKLVVEVAGTMTSEAVKSFVDVVVSTASRHFSTNMNGGWNKVKSVVRKQVGSYGYELQSKSGDLAMKAFILSSICLAICLHVLAGLRVVESI